MSGKIPQRELQPGNMNVGAFNHAGQFLAVADGTIAKWDILIPSDTQNSAKLKLIRAVNSTVTLYRGPLFIAMHAATDGGAIRVSEAPVVAPDLNTSGLTALEPIYLTTSGGWTGTKPTNGIAIGLVLEVSATVGVVLFCPNSANLGPLAESTLFLTRAMRPQGVNSLPRRFELKWVAGQRGKPSINADINSATEATREIADPDFEVLGTNGTSDDVTFYAEGGIKLETDGADGDEVIVLPHLDANQSAWAQVTWGTDKETIWECDIAVGSNITNTIIWAGLKLTNTEVTATDADQAFFRYEDDVNGGKWQYIYSIGGTDTPTDSGITVAVSTRYHLKVIIDSARLARFYLNEVLLGTSTALTDATDFIPYIGVAADGAGAAKHMYIYGQAISRTIG